MKNAIEDAVRKAAAGKNIAVAFSGGLDSGILAALTMKHASGYSLYTVGTEGSSDVRTAASYNNEFRSHWVHIPIDEHCVLEGLRSIISITGVKDPVTLSFEIPLYFVCKECREKEIITGQGADELFGGYSKYINLKEEDLKNMISEDLKKLRESTLICERKIAEFFKKSIHHPFTDAPVVTAVNDLGVGEIKSTDDPASRKRILREVAVSMGYPEIASMEKKAAQYGSGAMAILKKICKSKGVTYSELIEKIAEGEI